MGINHTIDMYIMIAYINWIIHPTITKPTCTCHNTPIHTEDWSDHRTRLTPDCIVPFTIIPKDVHNLAYGFNFSFETVHVS